MSTASKVLMYDIDNIIPEYVLWYLSKFKIEVSEGEVLRHDSESNIDYCQGIFKFKGNTLSIVKQILKQGMETEREECCWHILDSDNVEANGNGVIIRNDRIVFRLKNNTGTNTDLSWRILLKKIERGFAFEFSSVLTGVVGELRIIYDESTGNIIICLVFGEDINKIVADRKNKNEVIIPFDIPHKIAKDYAEKISDGFTKADFLKQVVDRVSPQNIEYMNIELDLIYAMIDDPRVVEIINKMMESIPEILRKKEKEEIDEEYHWENCDSPEAVYDLWLKYMGQFKASMGLLEQRIGVYNSGADKGSVKVKE